MDVKVEAKEEVVHDSVKEYYGRILKSTKDLRTSACCTKNPPPKHIREILEKIPDPVITRFYGCGTPLPTGIQGLKVLDLGSGSGRDVYLAAALVGPEGHVTGLDMTEEQLGVARSHVDEYMQTLGYSQPNITFKQGYIENIAAAGIADESVDLVISNCVVNLSPDKRSVLQGVYRALKNGGEFYFSDVYADRRLPQAVRQHPVLFGECLGGALYIQDFIRLCHEVGFLDPREMIRTPIKVHDEELAALVGNTQFYSITYRLFKLPGLLESKCEDYGQVAYYRGTLPGAPHKFVLDDHHVFQTNKRKLVCGNTASMLADSWLGQHFVIEGDRSVHYGLFDCSPAGSSGSTSGGCC
eukprot:TRINITY_DN1185_c0_g3_i1.p1 TRINITY_DN1185_c0_g3~~TRINITY_DN1185_c0_g3_i1.p1  ORF type:complete len:355 (-),score=83.02 TRINITY_DN1185_c0_g3_i1:67-1131(-)